MFAEQLAMWVQILGLPIAIIGLLISIRSSTRSQDIQIILSFVESFRDQWENGWADLLDHIEDDGIDNLPRDEVQKTRYMLNWIDWVGRLSHSRTLKKEEIILRSLKPSLMRAIQLASPLIENDCKDQGHDYWAGVHFVKSRLEKL